MHQAERGQRSFTAAELTALALALDASVPTLFRADDEPIELPRRAVSAQEYRGILLNRDPEAPLDGVEEMIVALHDIGEVLARPALAQLARIGRAAEQRRARTAARTPGRWSVAGTPLVVVVGAPDFGKGETAGLNDDAGPTVALRACGWKCTGVTRARQHCRSRSGGRDPVTE